MITATHKHAVKHMLDQVRFNRTPCVSESLKETTHSTKYIHLPTNTKKILATGLHNEKLNRGKKCQWAPPGKPMDVHLHCVIEKKSSVSEKNIYISIASSDTQYK